MPGNSTGHYIVQPGSSKSKIDVFDTADGRPLLRHYTLGFERLVSDDYDRHDQPRPSTLNIFAVRDRLIR